MGTLLLVRHGQASYGQADYDRLSPRGHDQARALGPVLAAARLDALYAGPHRRQQETAAGAGGGVTLPTVQTLPGLAEYPAFEILKHLTPRLRALDPKFADLESAPTPRLLDEAFHTVLHRWASDEWLADGLERVADFVERVRTAIHDLVRTAASGARIAAVTSAGPIGVAVGMVFDLPATRAVKTSIVIRNASITELRFRSGHPDQITLVTLNSTGHLPAELTTER